MFLTNTFSRNNKKICKPLKVLAAQTGFEPVTCPLGGTHLTQLDVTTKTKLNVINTVKVSRDAPSDSSDTTNQLLLTRKRLSHIVDRSVSCVHNNGANTQKVRAMNPQKKKKTTKPHLTARERTQLVRDYRRGASRALLMANYSISNGTFYKLVKGVERASEVYTAKPTEHYESDIIRKYRASKRGEMAVAFMDMKGSTANYIKGMAMALDKTEAEVVDELVDFKMGNNG